MTGFVWWNDGLHLDGCQILFCRKTTSFGKMPVFIPQKDEFRSSKREVSFDRKTIFVSREKELISKMGIVRIILQRVEFIY